MRRLLTSLACAAAIGACAAKAEPLAGSNLKETIAGKTVMMSMYLGSMPIKYRSNGTMTAKSNAVGAVVGISKDTGRWWVSGRNLCQKWRRWFSGRKYCHAMSKKGKTLYWTRNDGLSGTARVIR